MKNETNTYFQTLQQAEAAYLEAQAAHKTEREALLTAGNRAALDAWFNSSRDRSSTFEVRTLPWDEEVHDFVKTLRAAGVSEFAVTDCSTALLRSLHRMAEEGCAMLGLGKITRIENRWGSEITTEYEAIFLRT